MARPESPATREPATEPARPWLIQRLSEQRHPSKTSRGIDRHFRLDYMGSAEYEGAAPRLSLAAMRADGDIGISTTEVATTGGGTHALHLIGPAPRLAWYADGLRAWIDAGAKAQEYTYVTERLQGSASSGSTTIAWWDLSNHVFFTFDHAAAQRIETALNAPLEATS